jgi:hypothetical protein
LNIEQRIQGLAKLGTILNQSQDEFVQSLILDAERHNPWFTQDNVRRAIQALAAQLSEEQLKNWAAPYPFQEATSKQVGLICAGNIPLVGFHDLLAILVAGFRVQLKLSSNDQVLYRRILQKLIEIEPGFQSLIAEVTRLQEFDLVIATGSDNSARYFDYYFGKYPHIIRKNRNSLAILTGNETSTQIHALGDDIFSYFGLGCRNVSKILVPKGYEMRTFFEGIANYERVFDHFKYANNYDFNKSIYLINGDFHYDNGFLLVKPSTQLASPLAVLYFEEYDAISEVREVIAAQKDAIQCVVGDVQLENEIGHAIIPFGQSQSPTLWDYADGVNTMDFLAAHFRKN